MTAVLVTGASGGIGSAVSLAYARRGADLVLVARSDRDLGALAQRCRDGGAASARVVVADVAEQDAVLAAVAAVVREHGRLDVVVHAAAVLAYGRFEAVPAQVWDRAVVVGILGTANVARAVLPRLAEQGGGSLVVVGSVLGEATVPFMSSYVTGKWAVRGLVRTLRQEARATPGVHVALVSPGSIDTAIYRLAGSYVGRTGRPPPPVYPPQRVAEAVLKVVDGRRATASVSVTNPLIRLGFTLTPWLYDALVTPLMRVAGLSRRAVAPHPGNVLRPSQDVRER